MSDQVDFLHVDIENVENFQKVITLMGLARQAQSTPNKQFAIPYTFQKRDER